MNSGTTTQGVGASSGSVAILSHHEAYTSFTFGSEVIRFRTPSNLVRYTRVKVWEDGYLEVGADYGNGEEEEYIDLRPILDNLFYEADAFLKPIKKVEVCYA